MTSCGLLAPLRDRGQGQAPVTLLIPFGLLVGGSFLHLEGQALLGGQGTAGGDSCGTAVLSTSRPTSLSDLTLYKNVVTFHFGPSSEITGVMGARKPWRMHSSTRWIVEIVVVSVILLCLSWAVDQGVARLSPSYELEPIEKTLVTLYLLLAGLVVETVRWARESIEQASQHAGSVLRGQLSEAAEKAVRGAVLRSIFPSGNPDPVSAQIHFGIVEDYLRQVEGRPMLVQRASGVLAKRHLAAWRYEMDELVGKTGVRLRMDESARMSASMMEGGSKYVTIERSPCDPEKSWSPGFLKFIDEIGSLEEVQKKFILLAPAGTLWGEGGELGRQEKARALFLREEAYLRRRGFQIFFCDERVVHIELGTTEIPRQNFEVFSGQVALQMEPAEDYDRPLTVRLSALAEIDELRRLLQIVEEQGERMTSRKIKSRRISSTARDTDGSRG